MNGKYTLTKENWKSFAYSMTRFVVSAAIGWLLTQISSNPGLFGYSTTIVFGLLKIGGEFLKESPSEKRY